MRIGLILLLKKLAKISRRKLFSMHYKQNRLKYKFIYHKIVKYKVNKLLMDKKINRLNSARKNKRSSKKEK